VLAREREDRGVHVVRGGPRDPRRAIGVRADGEEARAQRAVHLMDVVLGALGVHRGDDGPALGQHVLVEPARGEQLKGRLLDVALGAVELLEHQDARARAGQDRRRRVRRAPVLGLRQAHEVGRLEQREVEHHEADAELGGQLFDELALSDPRRSLQEHGPSRGVRDLEHGAEARPDGQLVGQQVVAHPKNVERITGESDPFSSS